MYEFKPMHTGNVRPMDGDFEEARGFLLEWPKLAEAYDYTWLGAPTWFNDGYDFRPYMVGELPFARHHPIEQLAIAAVILRTSEAAAPHRYDIRGMTTSVYVIKRAVERSDAYIAREIAAMAAVMCGLKIQRVPGRIMCNLSLRSPLAKALRKVSHHLTLEHVMQAA